MPFDENQSGGRGGGDSDPHGNGFAVGKHLYVEAAFQLSEIKLANALNGKDICTKCAVVELMARARASYIDVCRLLGESEDYITKALDTADKMAQQYADDYRDTRAAKAKGEESGHSNPDN